MKKNIFQDVPFRKPSMSKFDLSHEKKLTMNMGELIPAMCMEVVPGDSFRVDSEMMMRFAPMLAPIMHRIDATMHYFFVPNRLIWDEWQSFITGGRLGDSLPVPPYYQITNPNIAYVKKGTVADYLGVPAVPNTGTITQPFNLSALPFRAYQLIWDEYYRDQNLVAPLGVPKTSGLQNAEIPTTMILRKRAWEKDYFTSALPFQQRGTAASSPITGTATPSYKNVSRIIDEFGFPATGDLETVTGDLNLVGAGAKARVENIDSISVSGGFDIVTLRRALKLQEWLEKNARAGGRYIEQILAHFGVVTPDYRLQRPEYLGGGKFPVVISEVLSTVKETTLPQGNMAGHAIGVGTANRFTKRFEEHGFVFGMFSVLPKTAYQQGLDKMFSRTDKFEYLWPEFANIGEQAVRLKELYLPWMNPAIDGEKVFGFQSRYAEYKFRPSTVHGDFTDQLAFWQAGRIFAGEPALNAAFVEADPTQRIFAVVDPSVHKLYVQVYHNVSAIRALPYNDLPHI